MKKRKRIIIGLSILAAVLFLFYLNYFATPEPHSDTIAIVNRKQLSVNDFKEKLNEIRANLPPKSDLNISELKNTVIRRLIIEALVLEEADRKNIKLSTDEINRYINNIKQGFSKEEFEQILLNQFKTYEAWENEIKNKLLIDKTISKNVTDKINVTDREITDYYRNYYNYKETEPKVKIAQIFTNTRDEAEEALNKVRTGQSFEETARKMSKGPEAGKDGYLGTFSKNEGIEIFDMAFDMKPGEISEIVQTDYGFHILKLIDIVQPKTITLEEAKPRIVQEIIKEKEMKLYEEWLKELFSRAKIIKNTTLIDSIK